MSLRVLSLVPLVAVVVLGCAGSASPPSGPGDSDGAQDGGSASPSLPTPKAVASPGTGQSGDRPPFADGTDPPQTLFAAVAANAAGQAGVDPSAVELVDARAVEWPDSSLGCPKPGMQYTQALVSGWQIVVQAADRTYDYRVLAADRFKICEP